MKFGDDGGIAWLAGVRSGGDARLAAMDVLKCVGEYRRAERQIRYLQAWQTRLLAKLRTLTSEEEAVTEIAAALQTPRAAAKAKIDSAVGVVERLPYTLASLREGEIDLDRATAIEKGTKACDRTVSGLVEDKILDKATHRTATQVRRSVRDAVRKLDPDHCPPRRVREPAGMSVAVVNEAGGMADLVAHMPSRAAKEVFSKIDDVASRMGAGDVGMRRVAAMVQLVMDRTDHSLTASSAAVETATSPQRADTELAGGPAASDLAPGVSSTGSVGRHDRDEVAAVSTKDGRAGRRRIVKARGNRVGHSRQILYSGQRGVIRGVVVRQLGRVTVMPNRVPPGKSPAADGVIYHRSTA